MAAAPAAVAALAAWKWCYSLACLKFTGAALTKVFKKWCTLKTDLFRIIFVDNLKLDCKENVRIVCF